MDWFLIITATIIYLGVIGFLFDIRLMYDVTKNNGVLSVKLFKAIPIVNLELKIEGNVLNFSKAKKKAKSLKVKLNSQNIKFLDVLKNNLIHRIYISRISVDSIVILDNPKIASIFSGTLYLLLNYLRYFLCRWQRDLDMTNNVVTGFSGNRFVLFFEGTVVVSIIDLMWAIIKSVFERKLNGKKYRQFDI
ncbi:MAG: hypothetical protein E7361_04305 [Clostridiales bacterium]|nr:hypothetical protein [Clostridiales bacterium]